MTSSQDQALESLERSPYDNSRSYLHKQSIKMNVPVRFILIQPKSKLGNLTSENIFVESFDIDEHPEATFITVFDFFRNEVVLNPSISLSDLWKLTVQFQGESFNPIEFIPIWLHAIPEYRINNAEVFKQISNFRKQTNIEENFNNMDDVLKFYDRWLAEYQKELQKDHQNARKLIQDQLTISSMTPLPVSPITVESITVSFDLRYEINPLIDYFNNAITDYLVPFIRYNSQTIANGEKSYYKIYRGYSSDSQPNYNNTTLENGKTNKPNTMYVNLWTGVGSSEDARNDKKDNFQMAILAYLEDRHILRVRLTSPINSSMNEHIMLDRLLKHLPDLPKPPESIIQENRISGSFLVYGPRIFEDVFHYFTLNDPVFSTYIYIEESSSSMATKQQLTIYYRGLMKNLNIQQTPQNVNLAPVNANLIQEKIPAGQIIEVNQNGSVVERQTQNETPTLRVKLNKASSRYITDQFVNVISRLLYRYITCAPLVINYIREYVPEYDQIINQETTQIIIPSTGQPELPPATIDANGNFIVPNKRLDTLRKYASDIFVADYARHGCQANYQPLMIRPNEIEAWRAKTVPTPRGPEPRRIMEFPNTNELFQSIYSPEKVRYYVCPTDEIPYPGLKENKGLSNIKDYPFVPCCFKTDPDTRNSVYNRAVRNPGTETIKVAATKGNNRLTTDKILAPSRTGIINTTVNTFLKSYSSNSGTFYRYGVPKEPNSFIHCILYAMQVPEYLHATDRVEWVNDFQRNLFQDTRIHPEILKQELYDMTNEQIVESAIDTTAFFDPLLYYRLIEILYNCNIYVFNLMDKDRNTGADNNLLEIPRHKHFHSHPPFIGKSTICVLRHMGAESSHLKYPHVELIYEERLNPGSSVPLNYYQFDQRMNTLIYPAMLYVSRSLTWQFVGNSLDVRQNMYSTVNYQYTFGQIPIIGQIIDNSGKVRFLALAPEWANDEHTQLSELRVFLGIPPSAPLNLPVFDSSKISHLFPDYIKTIELFGRPVNATLSKDKQFINGLWFAMGDITYGVYCPVKNISLNDFHETYPDVSTNSDLVPYNMPDVHPDKFSIIDTYRNLRRIAQYIIQTVKYLYIKAGQPKDVRQWLIEITVLADPAIVVPSNLGSTSIQTVPPGKIPSSRYYNIRNFKRILPDGNVEEILRQLSIENPSTFPNGRLLIYDEQMFTGMVYQITRFSKDISGINVSSNAYRQLDNYYSSLDDFKVQLDEFLLIGTQEYSSWTSTHVYSSNLQQRSIQNLKNKIQNILNPNAFTYQEPYIYSTSGNPIIKTSINPADDKYYIIQNVAAGNIYRAINVSYNWYTNKQNLGFSAEEYKMQNGVFPVHKIFRISPGGDLLLEQDSSTGNENYLQILNYGNSIYAAILPIL